jgi:transcriptional regulator with XRE-family HTH domain
MTIKGQGGRLQIILERLYELRKKHHMNQDDVAGILGVARSTYGMYEIGERQMDYELLVKLANHYKVSLDYIFGRTDLPMHYDNMSPDEIEFLSKVFYLYKEIKDKFNY